MSDPNLRSHAAHRTQQDLPTDYLPSQQLHAESEEVQAMLEELDDVIFEAVRGDAQALQRAHVLWPRVVNEIGWELVEESREQYLRYAVEVTRRFQLTSGAPPERSIAALDIISLLTKG